jgi:uncharacterized membrane protein YqjE
VRDIPDESEPFIPAILTRAAASLAGAIRAEGRLARLEIAGPKARRAGALVLIGAVAALYGLGFVFTAVYLVMSQVLRPWVAALIVGLLLFVGGGLVAWMSARYFKRAGR